MIKPGILADLYLSRIDALIVGIFLWIKTGTSGINGLVPWGTMIHLGPDDVLKD